LLKDGSWHGRDSNQRFGKLRSIPSGSMISNIFGTSRYRFCRDFFITSRGVMRVRRLNDEAKYWEEENPRSSATPVTVAPPAARRRRASSMRRRRANSAGGIPSFSLKRALKRDGESPAIEERISMVSSPGSPGWSRCG
jgi:hypothetical protein